MGCVQNFRKRRTLANKPPNKSTPRKISSQDLEYKFSRMSLTPSQNDVLRVVKKPCYKIRPKIKCQDNAGTIRYKTMEDLGYPPILPWDLTAAMKRAGVLIKQMEAVSDNFRIGLFLKVAENNIDRIADYRKHTRDLPSDWKYDRATAILFAP